MDLITRAMHLWLRRLAERSPLSEGDRATILGLPRVLEEYASGRDVIKLGEKTTHSCLVADGLLARFGQTCEGLRQFTAFYIPGDMGDLHSAMLPRVTAPMQSASHVSLVRIPHNAIRAAAAGSTAISEAFWRDCVADAQIACEWLLNNGRRDARARVAHVLCELAARYRKIGCEKGRFPIHMTQAHMADATSLTSVHVNRTLRQLREANMIEIAGREAIILDWDRLRAIADFREDYLHFGHEEAAVNIRIG